MKVYIYCDGGFGNRYNALISGLYLANLVTAEPQVIWCSNNWCGAGFDELFESTISFSETFNPTEFFQHHSTLNIIHENQFHLALNYKTPNSFTEVEIISTIKEAQQDVFYFTNLIPDWVYKEKLYKEIIPMVNFHADIQLLAQRHLLEHAGHQPFVGVHLRKTDFAGNFDDRVLYQYMQQAIDTKFFVCSDDHATEQQFKQLANVFTYPKTSYVEKLAPGSWNSVITDTTGNQWPFNVNRSAESVRQAVVDLLILSHSVLLDTDLRSTFLKTAALLQTARNYQ